MIHPVRLDSEHRYFIPGPTGEVQRPGYSEICMAMGVTRPNPFYTSQGRERGVAVHAWGSFHAQGRTSTADPDDRIKGRVEQVKRFLESSKFVLAGTERSMYDPVNGYCCTPDLYGSAGLWQWIIDLKTGGKQKSHALQTAAQKIALAANGFRAQKRGAAYLRDDNYRLTEHDDAGDEARWKAIVLAYHILTADERTVFAAEGFDLESFGREKKARFRIIENAHNARSYYI